MGGRCVSGFPFRRAPLKSRKTEIPKDRQEEIAEFRGGVAERIRVLESIVARLDLIPEPCAAESVVQPTLVGRDVFVVHGHDEGAKETVARFLEKLDLNPIILHEQASRGMTLMEKFEQHSGVALAVVILTPDDLGHPKERPADAKLRARQNVIFELGFFIGKLGREHVCVLRNGDVETPTDFDGVLYIPMDDKGWRTTLAREIRAAGVSVDLNAL